MSAWGKTSAAAGAGRGLHDDPSASTPRPRAHTLSNGVATVVRRPCIEPSCSALTEGTRCAGCHAAHQRRRNADPKRRALYDTDWRRHSAERRAEQPWCSHCYSTERLSLDHPTDAVLCLSCHSAMEARRRAVGTTDH